MCIRDRFYLVDQLQQMVYLVNVKFVHVIEPVVVSETFQQIKFFCGDSFHFLLIKTNGIILVNLSLIHI